jgi:hypothetical protein
MKLFNSNEVIEICIHFPDSIPINYNALEKTYQINILGHEGRLTFPRLNMKDLKVEEGVIKFQNLEVIPPPSYTNIKDYLKDSIASTGRNSIGAIRIEYCLLSFKYSVVFLNQIDDIKNYISNYYVPKFILGIEIKSRRILIFNDFKKAKISAFYDKRGSISTGEPIEINILLESSKGIESEIITWTLKNVNEKLDYLIEHEVLRNAREHLINQNYRLCIIELGTALEISLHKICNEHLEKQNNPDFAKDLLSNKYKTLGGKLDLCEKLKLNDVRHRFNNLVDHRNKSVHKGIIPSPEDTSECYRLVDEFIYGIPFNKTARSFHSPEG